MRPFLLACALISIVAAGCGGEAATPPTSNELRGADRPPAPSVEGTSLTGERIALEGFRGRPVLVNVWSSW